MLFASPLIEGRLIKRYKRFLADVRLADDSVVTAHTANSGSMLGCSTPGAEVWLSPASNPERKLKYTWELVRGNDGALIGVNTSHPNALAAEAIKDGLIPELRGYDSLRREVKYGKNSRIDVLLTSDGRPTCYVEVKNVTLFRQGQAQFPDAVTARGTKHLAELSDMVAQGHRAVMLYVVQRERNELSGFSVAKDIDPTYAEALHAAFTAGVEAICYCCRVSPQELCITDPLPVADLQI